METGWCPGDKHTGTIQTWGQSPHQATLHQAKDIWSLHGHQTWEHILPCSPGSHCFLTEAPGSNSCLSLSRELNPTQAQDIANGQGSPKGTVQASSAQPNALSIQSMSVHSSLGQKSNHP